MDQSVDSVQALRTKGFITGYISIDTDPYLAALFDLHGSHPHWFDGDALKEAHMALKFNLPGKSATPPKNLKFTPKQQQEQVEKPLPGQAIADAIDEQTYKAGKAQQDAKQHALAVFGHEEVVDKYLELEAELAPFTDKFKELATLRQTALDLAKETGEEDPELPVYVRGTEKSLVFTKASVANIVTDKEGLMKALKAKVPVEALWDMVKFSQADIKKYLSEVEAAPFMGTTQGPRRFDKVTPNT